VVSDEFGPLARAESQVLGLPALPLIAIPHPLAGNQAALVEAKAQAIANEVAHALLDPVSVLEARYAERFLALTEKRLAGGVVCVEDVCATDPGMTNPGDSLLISSISRWLTPAGWEISKLAPDLTTPTVMVDGNLLDEAFEARGWSDGLPVVAPTRARVDAMLRYSDRSPVHELGSMPPRQGVVTLEILAVNAVMAGCRPEYFPVVVAAVEAMLDPTFNLFAVQATTHPCAPCLIVNGPIARELGINARYGAFGPGVRANATIGRAIRLILQNVGGAAPGLLDRSTQGQPAKYAYCVAENEAESPWPPLQVERGHAATTSTVTVTAAEGPHNLNDHVSQSAAGILATLRGAMNDMGSNNAYLYGQPTIAFGPEHAAILAADGYDRDAIRRYVFEQVRLPRALWRQGGMAGMFEDLFPDAEQMPIIKAPEDLLIIVVGGFGRHSCWLPTFGDTTRAVTKPIVRADGTPLASVTELLRRD